MLFITEGFPSIPFKPKFSWETKEYILVELNLRKRNWLIICIRNSHKTTTYSYLKDISTKTDSPASKYENIILSRIH